MENEHEHKHMENEHKQEEHKPEVKTEEKHQHQEKKVEVKKQEQKKRDFACVSGLNLNMSTKEGLHVCDMIRYKKVDDAIHMATQVTKLKRAVMMHNREVGHKKGMMGGRYPVNACIEFILLLKKLNVNPLHLFFKIQG